VLLWPRPLLVCAMSRLRLLFSVLLSILTVCDRLCSFTQNNNTMMDFITADIPSPLSSSYLAPPLAIVSPFPSPSSPSAPYESPFKTIALEANSIVPVDVQEVHIYTRTYVHPHTHI